MDACLRLPSYVGLDVFKYSKSRTYGKVGCPADVETLILDGEIGEEADENLGHSRKTSDVLGRAREL